MFRLVYSAAFVVLGCNAIVGIEPAVAPEEVGGGPGSAQAGASGDAGAPGGFGGDAGNTAGTPIELEIRVQRDLDDCTWVNGTDERLHYAADSALLEVGADDEAARVGLRFKVPAPPGSKITSAIVRLHREEGSARPDDSIKFQVFDSVFVPPFDDGHTHMPEEHAAVWPDVIGRVWVGENKTAFDSSELKALIQHVVDKPEWQPDGMLGFLVSADVMPDRWVAFADRTFGQGQALLKLSYIPP